ncbi:MAG: segregation/condensation protein A [Rhodobiaceae bacterium]|nr:segregation/condensation protein A [Rhodobiaceae bacterium]MCC0018879.1 segregation/condensation protein A [Rhodobiaceae bacterium]MCC0051690.1 segregation/condensation protein A [Rhodobiaceae bacterium]MCC0060726.1 segregation/condensation protein A [Rhodobiaceae bacterium]
MSTTTFEEDTHGVRPAGQEQAGEALIVDVAGFEGPLDLLLALARAQKVDLARVSILALAEQYLGFIQTARQLRLELAADYLVMAAWLAYLKSRLLLPEPEDDEPTGEELAEVLAFRLRRLESMREAAAKLMNRNRLGRDVFARGQPEGVTAIRRSSWDADLIDLLKAYADRRQKSVPRTYVMRSRDVWPLADAREALTRLLGPLADWTPIDRILASYLDETPARGSIMASGFAASLELVREGMAELRQDRHFAPLMVRSARGE